MRSAPGRVRSNEMTKAKKTISSKPPENSAIQERIPAIYYSKYLSEGQELLLKRTPLLGNDQQFDSISGTLMECKETAVKIRLNSHLDSDERYPFFPGMPFEIYADCYGLGLCFTGTFEELLDADQILMKPQGALNLFFRRQHLRAQTTLWLSCIRSTESLRTMRRTWKKHSALLQRNQSVDQLPPIIRQKISLGAGGLQLLLPAPVKIHEFCLVYLALMDNGPLVCALCETVWTGNPDDTGNQTAGLEFRNIVASGLQRINRFVNKSLRYNSA